MKKKVNNTDKVLGVIGLGYVGLPLSIEFVNSGYRTIGFDIDEKKVNMLKSGKTYIKHIGEYRVKEMIDANLFEPTSDFSRIRELERYQELRKKLF